MKLSSYGPAGLLAVLAVLSAPSVKGSLRVQPLNVVAVRPQGQENDSPAGAAVRAEQVLGLQDLIDTALTHNPTITMALEQLQQSRGRQVKARSGYLPRVSVAGDYSRMHIDNMVPEDEDDVTAASMRLTQLLYDFGRTLGAMDAARFQVLAAEANLLQLRRNILYQVKAAYYDVLEKERLVGVAAEAVDNYQRHLTRAKAYLSAGVRTKIDVTNAEVNLSNARLALMRARYDRKASLVRLEQVLGVRPAAGDYRLEGGIGDLASLARGMPPLPGALEEMLAKARKQRADLRQYESFVKAAEAGVQRARGGFFPSVQAHAGYDAYETDLPAMEDTWQVGVGLTWEIFSGFAVKGDVAEARGILMEAKAALRNLELAAKQQVTDAFLRADENREGVLIAEQTLKLASENLQQAEERYKAGLGDMIEYNDAQLRHIRAQSDLVISYFAYLTALARLENAVGEARFDDTGRLAR